MIKKIAHIVVWIILVCWFMVIMGFVSKTNSGILCSEIIVSVSDTVEVKFITGNGVRELITNSEINTQGYPVEGIRTRDLERLIETDPYVCNAEVYINVEGNLLVDIDQRRPLIRVMPNDKEGFYIDHEEMILPLSPHYSPMVLLLTGHVAIAEKEDKNGMRRVATENNKSLQNLLEFAKMVEKHPFWSKQIMQLYRLPGGDYEMIPRVGAHQIELGTLDDYASKLQKLKLLYDQGLKMYGWNNYDKINLKYSNQIICTKR